MAKRIKGSNVQAVITDGKVTGLAVNGQDIGVVTATSSTNGVGLQAGDLRLSADAWSICSSRPLQPKALRTDVASMTTRVLHTVPFAVRAIRLMYAGYYNRTVGNGECPIPNPVMIKASVQPVVSIADETVPVANSYDVIFTGRANAVLSRGGLLLSDPINLPLPAGASFYVKTYQSANLPAAPTAPTLAQVATGGALSNSTVKVAYTVVYADPGLESQVSSGTSITLNGGTATQVITATAPTAVPGAVGYRVWVTLAGGAEPYYDGNCGIVPFGTAATIYALPAISTNVDTYEVVLPSTPAALIYSTSAIMGGTAIGGAGTGEGVVTGRDLTSGVAGYAVPSSASSSGAFGPIAILGLTYGEQGSVAVVGDSIGDGAHDAGHGGVSGFMARGAQAQFGRKYDPTIVPTVGLLTLAQGGETPYQAATLSANRRYQLAAFARSVISDHCTNNIGVGGPFTIDFIIKIVDRTLGIGKRHFHTTCTPRHKSTDGFVSIANHTQDNVSREAARRQCNAFLRDTTGPGYVSAEAPMRCPAGTVSSSYNFYGPADGAITVFCTRNAFVTGSETVKVNGSTVSGYSYYNTRTIGGVQYAQGVTFASAPANGSVISCDYTKISGLRAMRQGVVVFDTAARVEVNSAGVLDINGGWWPGNAQTFQSGVAITSASPQFMNTGALNLTVDQYRGYSITITADATTPASVGQSRGIRYNDVNSFQLAFSFDVTPSAGAIFSITDTATGDGIHPSTRMHIEMAKAIDPTLF